MDTITESEVARRRATLENSTAGWRRTSLATAFDRAASRYADRPAVITERGSLSYEDVRDTSRRIAAGLISIGVSVGEHVALLVDNRLEYIAIKLAIARVGAIAVPLNYSYKKDEIAQRLRQSNAAVLVCIDASAATNFLEALDSIAPGWEHGAHSDAVPTLRTVILVDGDKRQGALDLTTLVARAERMDEVDRRTAALTGDEVCDIVFTSGTTGHALGAELTHDMVLRSAYGSAYHRAFDDGWRIGFALPLYHVFGYIEGMLAAWFVGGAIVPQRVFNPKTALAQIEEHRINEVLFVPTMTIAVVDQAVKEDYDVSSLQSVFSAAAAAPVWLWERVMSDLRPTMIFTGYGQTEVSAATALTYPRDDIQTVSSVVGAPKLGGCAAVDDDGGRLAVYRTLDPFTGEPLPDGEAGELSVRGPQVTRAYYDNPGRTAEAIDHDGWLRTGDLGRIDERGYLVLSGRSSELFKVGGELVAPAEVERVLTGADGVSQAYVVGVPDERFGEVGWAWVVAAEGAALDAHELVAHCREHLAGFKVPRGVTFVEADGLPMTATGKVQKYLLAQQRAAQPSEQHTLGA